MSQSLSRRPPVAVLKQFRHLDDLNDGQLELLSKSLRIHKAAKGTVLLRRGAHANFSLFLLKGELLLEDAERRRQRVRAGNELAAGPIAPDLPRHFTVVCLSEVHYLEVDNHLLADLRIAAHSQAGVAALAAPDTASTDVYAEVVDAIRADLDADCLLMPTLPDVALRVGRAMNDETSDVKQVAAAVQTDPAMAAKLIRVANSAFYGASAAPRTCADAVRRLGFKTTYKLVLCFALREVFVSNSPLMEARMRALWRHSVKVAAYCFALAKQAPLFDAEQALLCGLVHDIGVVSLISYVARYPVTADGGEILERLEHDFRGEISAMILRRWRFPGELATCAEEAEHWLREHEDPTPDYCDLLVTAQVLSCRGTEQAAQLPALGSMPAVRKLGLTEWLSDQSGGVPEPLRDQLLLAESLFAA